MHPGLLATTLVALLHAPPSAAEGKVVELRWDSPVSCPDEAAVRRQVEDILGVSLAVPRPRALSVIAVVRDEGGTRSLRIFTVTEEGTRERALRYDRDCGLLTRAAAVVIAITIDPTSLGRLSPEALALLGPPPPRTVEPQEVEPHEPVPEPVPEPLPKREALPKPTPPPKPAVKRARPWQARGALRVLGGVSVGDLPGINGGVSGAAALVFRHLRLELAASLWPARRARFVGTDAGADFVVWAVGPRLCGVVYPHRVLEVPLCLGVEAGQVKATPIGLENGVISRVTWVAGLFAPSLVVVPLRRMAVWVAPELLVPTRPTFSIEDVGPIHRAGPVAGRFMAGIEVRFP